MTRAPLALIGLLAVLLAACGTTSSPQPSAGSVIPGDASDVGRYFKISEVGLGPEGWVTLVNYTDTGASLDTLFLCQARGCVDLPAHDVAPGAEARVAVGSGAGLKNVAMTEADLELLPPNGEIALYSKNDVNDARAMRTYLEWGSTPHGLTQVAIDNAIWFKGSYAPSGPDATRLWQNDAGLWLWDPG